MIPPSFKHQPVKDVRVLGMNGEDPTRPFLNPGMVQTFGYDEEKCFFFLQYLMSNEGY